MRPEFAVAIPEVITTIIAGFAFAFAILALYKDAYWENACEGSVYYQPYITWIKQNSGKYEMSRFQRDVFYQSVVTSFIAPTVIHLTIHLVLTFVHKAPDEEYVVDDLDTPEEDPEFLSATPVTMIDTPENQPSTTSQGEHPHGDHPQNGFAWWATQFFCMQNRRNSDDSQQSAPVRKSASLPGRIQEYHHAPAQILRKNSLSAPNLPPETICKTAAGKRGSKASLKLKRTSTNGFIPPHTTPKDTSDTDLTIHDATSGASEQDQDQSSHTSVPEAKFVNPRLLKLLLLASIIFECMLAFSASYYEFTEMTRYDKYVSNKNITSQIHSPDPGMRRVALMIASCRRTDRSAEHQLTTEFPGMEKERDAIYGCQDYRAKAWVVALCILYGVSGLTTTVIIYTQYRDTLALSYGGQYPLIDLRKERRKRYSESTGVGTQDEVIKSRDTFMVISPEEMQRRMRRQSFSEDEKLFSGYTVGNKAEYGVGSGIGLQNMN